MHITIKHDIRAYVTNTVKGIQQVCAQQREVVKARSKQELGRTELTNTRPLDYDRCTVTAVSYTISSITTPTQATRNIMF